MRRPVLVASLLAVLVACLGVVSAPPVQAAPSWGTVKVVVSAPAGVPANVLLTGATQKMATKPPAGTSRTVSLTFTPGTYRVSPQALAFEGDSFGSRASASSVAVRAGGSTTVYVTFFRLPSAADLRAVDVTETSISLDWTAPAGASFRLTRRAVAPAVGQSRLTKAVPVTGTSLVDSGVRPGTTYEYSLYTSVGGRWSGPLKLTAGTASAGSSGSAAYVAASDTLVARSENLSGVVVTGTGVRLTLAPGQAPRLLGSAVVLPPSPALSGGFLGRVASMSADGRTVDLVPAGIGDAFDHYSLDVASFGELEPASAPDDVAPAELLDCDVDGDPVVVTWSPSITLDGHADIEVDVGWTDVRADVDMGVSVRATGAVAVTAGGRASCELELPTLEYQIPVAPVPLALTFEPVAEVALEGAVTVSNLGVSATAGFGVEGWFSLGESDLDAERLLDIETLDPEYEVNAEVGLTLGGTVMLGLGGASKWAGAMVGLEGEIGVLEAGFEPAFASSDPRFGPCVEARVGGSAEVSLSATAWLGDWDVEHKLPIDVLSGEWDYLQPFHLPAGCRATPPSADLLGSGVEATDEETRGDARAIGRVTGLLPGGPHWTLSSGDVSDVPGVSSDHVHTRFFRPADEYFDDPDYWNVWHDAAYYDLELVPSGDTLHITYVFASDEYPEDVHLFDWGWLRNAVAILVDGENCATVPGTDERVSVNSINADENAQYFVDNGAGAQPTTMDGLTVPLTCSVPVVPGEQVSVRVFVQDFLDRSDTAIAIPDGGIWSD